MAEIVLSCTGSLRKGR